MSRGTYVLKRQSEACVSVRRVRAGCCQAVGEQAESGTGQSAIGTSEPSTALCSVSLPFHSPVTAAFILVPKTPLAVSPWHCPALSVFCNMPLGSDAIQFSQRCYSKQTWESILASAFRPCFSLRWGSRFNGFYELKTERPSRPHSTVPCSGP